MHELATLADRRDELDDQELAHLEEQSELADELAALDAAPAGAGVGARRRAAPRSRAAEAAIDAELAAIAASPRRGRRPHSTPALLERYERLRARLGGVAVARLEGSRCGGCHLDLSTDRAGRGAGRRRRASSPTARSAAGCSCPDDADVPLVHRHGDRHRLVRVPRPPLRLPPAGRRLGAAAGRRAVRRGRVLHTLVFSLVADGRRDAGDGRPAARRASCWLGLPIGTMLHLVFDGAWTDTDLFWWPLGGWSFDDAPAAGGRARAGGTCRSSSSGSPCWCGSGAAARLSDPARRRGVPGATAGCSPRRA